MPQVKPEKLNADIVAAIGPDWFQELSNQQCKTINDLAKCIMQDIKESNCIHTKQNLAVLGLVLRPRKEDVDLALRNCCGCRIEFLLSLYQLIEPNRKTYSINDRLLLSSVVHLTIRETLRELHVRIPSPPRKPKPKPKPKKREKKVLCDSPYLQPLFRIPDVKEKKYGKPDRQFPTNEYFNYKEELKKNSIILEMEKIPEKPNWSERFNGPYYDAYSIIEGELVKEWMFAQKIYNNLAKTNKVRALSKPSIYIPCLSRLPQFTKMPKPPTLQPPKWEQHRFGEQADHEIETPTGIEQKILDRALELFREKLRKEMEEFTNGEEEECECGVCRCCEEEGIGEGDEESLYEATEDYNRKKCTCRKDKKRSVPSLKPKSQPGCSCRKAIEENIEKGLCQCDRCKADRTRANRKTLHIIQDTLEGDPPIRIISGVQSQPKCTCLEKYRSRWDLYEKRQKVLCAQRDLKGQNKCYIITGCYTGPDGEVCYSIEGVAEVEPCACFKKRKVTVDEEKRAVMPEGCLRYIISGVVARPEGNVYIISGTTPNTDCECMKTYNRFTAEHVGCLLAYKQYMRKVREDTEAYFEELNPDYVEFEPELPAVSDYVKRNLEEDEIRCAKAKAELEKMFGCHCVEAECDATPSEGPSNSVCICEGECICDGECICKEGCICEEECICEGECVCEEECICEEECSCEEDPTCDCGVVDNNSELPCILRPAPSVSCACNPEDKKEAGDVKPRRYIILEQIPRKKCEQIKILKRALKQLAEDGWPLARLPDAYRLLHFKLWFQWRSGKFWTAKQRDQMLKTCVTYWEHFELKTFTKVLLPTVNTFLRECPEKHNWRYAPLIRYASRLIQDYYYRKVKAQRVDYARRLFSSCYDYEFPTKTFRDVYFAYLSSKEESVNARYVWQGESRDMRSYACRCST